MSRTSQPPRANKTSPNWTNVHPWATKVSLKNFINETTKRIAILPKVDDPTYSYIHI